METWRLAIEAAVVFILFVISADITISRLTQPVVNKKIDLTVMDIHREIRLTYLSAMTTIVYMALFSWLAIRFFIF